MSQAATLQEIHEENSESWGDVWLGIINLPGYESGLVEMTDGVDLPVLQDTTSDDVADAYGASKWYIYLVDRDGYPRRVFYQLDLDDERDRLLAEIAALVEE